MKALFLALSLTLAGSAAAQSGTVAPKPTSAPEQSKDELRALSGTLKETHGRVHQQLGAVEKQLATATPEGKEKLTKTQADLTAMKAALETELNNVNKATAETWTAVKNKAESVNKSAIELIDRLKKEGTAVN